LGLNQIYVEKILKTRQGPVGTQILCGKVIQFFVFR
jgi:hypothetical protein